MRLVILSLGAFLSLSLSISRTALADSASVSSDGLEIDSNPAPYFVGATGGVGWVNPSYTGLMSQSLVGASIGVHAGYVLSPRFAAAVEFNMIEKAVARNSETAPFGVPLGPLAGCDTCAPPAAGGWVTSTTVFFGHLAPRLEFSPFGQSGPYVGASAGLAVMRLIDYRLGFSGGLRAGYRVRVARIVDVGLEADAQGQAHAEGSALMFAGVAVFRPHF